MGLTSGLVDLAVRIIDTFGYAGVFVLMTMESMIFPVPSEGVMPFAGFLVAQGKMDLLLVTIVATLGSLLGSWLSYEIGKHWGRPFIDRWGKWFLLSHRDLDWTEKFFTRWGAWAVFVGRLIPVVRHLISLPAGLGRMPLGRFFLATAVGALIWNAFLAWVGWKLGQNWETIKTSLEPVDYAVVGILVLVLIWFIVAHVRRFRAESAAASDPAR